jgi:3',5'-nucleoside bisphosphate phosphatase
MKIYRADLHIHTLLSPCGDLKMSPVNIISEAVRKKIDIIGITDHNSTRQCSLIRRLGREKGIFVMTGAEVTTKEEVHCLAFFENSDTLNLFQEYLDASIPDIKNDPLIFGDQVVVDENEDIVYTEERLLINATVISIEELESYVHRNNGIFIPAHIDRMKNSIYSQLGFLPENLKADALEVSKRISPEKFALIHPEINSFPLVTDSDAHFPEHIGTVTNSLEMRKPSFEEIRMALAGIDGRRISALC